MTGSVPGGNALDLAITAVSSAPRDAEAALGLAAALQAHADPTQVHAVLEGLVRDCPGAIYAWLMLGSLLEGRGDRLGGLRAYFNAVTRAQPLGLWLGESTTPAPMLPTVAHAIEQVRLHRRELYLHSYDAVRERYGRDELRRVDRALAAHLKLVEATPSSPHQRPRFFYFPDLPPGPYHDPWLHPWTGRLAAAFTDLREEATRCLAEDQHFDDFLPNRPGAGPPAHLRAHRDVKPAWEAFFFYRHGERFDENHRRCPRTSRMLDEIELCRIEGDAPEICFSVLAPHTEILPHHGVTNVRSVMHLPLVVPPDCALSLGGAPDHHWVEGEPVLFDDTYLHSARNGSDQARIILLMDCWNPHLSPVERLAVRDLIETIGALGRAARAGRADDLAKATQAAL